MEDLVTAVEAAPHTPAVFSLRLERDQLAICGIVIAQAVWLWAIIGHGWYLQADFSNLADGLGRPLTWSYLREPLGGHFAPVMRLLYWLLTRVGALDYNLTVGLRVLLQGASTILLYRLLRLLVGRSTLMLVIVGLYAVNPLPVPGLAWLTSGLGLVLGQVFVLLAIESHVRYERSGELPHAIVTGLLLVLAILSADAWVVALSILPILSVGFLSQGTARQRLGSLAKRWRGWLATTLPVVGAGATILALGDPAGAQRLPIGAVYRLVRDAWLRSVGPSLVGGHLRWFVPQNTYLPYFAPTDSTILLGQAAFVVLIVVGIRRTGRRALIAWAIPITVVVASMIAVGIGRYGTYGRLLAITPRYSFVVAVPLAIAVALSLCNTTDPPNSDQPTGRSSQRLLGFGIAAVIAVSSVSSVVAFTRHWSKNPAKNYVASLLASARAAGPDLNVYNTALPSGLVSGAEPHHRVSDILRLGGLFAAYESPHSEPLVASADGRLTKSVFVPGAVGLGALQVNCGTYVHGPGTWSIPMSKSVPAAEWYLRFDLYQNAASTIAVDIVDATGRIAHPVQGAIVKLNQKLATVNLRLPAFAPVAVIVHSSAPATSLCLVHTVVGAPFPVGR
jgi:hypothetical protein